MREDPESRGAAHSSSCKASDTTATVEGKRPFMRPLIPAWLNRAGLSQAEFRVYCCLWSFADNLTGIAWPKAETIAEVCTMARNTVWKSIKSLEGRGLILRVGKPFQGSSRYQVLTPTSANGIPIEPATSANKTPVAEPPIGANQTPPTSANGILQPAQMDSREGYPKKGLQRRVSNRDISPEGIEFAQWFKSTLPETVNLQPDWLESFAKIYDNLVRIDNRTQEQIREVSRWARTDKFWSTNFMSPAKLRARNPDGIQYLDVFEAKMKQPAAPAASFNNGNRRGHEETLSGGHRQAKAAAEYPEPKYKLPML